MRKPPRGTCRGTPPLIENTLSDIPPEIQSSAKIYWRAYHYAHRELDEELRTFLDCPLPFEPPLRGARNALGLKMADVATKAGYSTAAYSRLELRDMKGTATVAAMAQAATAMDCELVLAVRPRGKRLYSDVVWDRLVPRALNNVLLWRLSGDRQARFLAYLVGQL